MRKMPISLLCGLGAILVTTILYFIILGNVFAELICGITLLGVLFAEAVTTLFAYLAKGNPRKVAAAFVSAIMIPVSLLLSVVYIVNFPFGYATYAGWYFACYIVVLVLAGILFVFNARKQTENADFQNAKSNMLEMRKLVKCILLEDAAKVYEKQLNAIEEKLHFSNDNVIAAEDAEIRAMLLELKENIADSAFDAAAMIAKLDKTIDTRNILSGRTV